MIRVVWITPISPRVQSIVKGLAVFLMIFLLSGCASLGSSSSSVSSEAARENDKDTGLVSVELATQACESALAVHLALPEFWPEYVDPDETTEEREERRRPYREAANGLDSHLDEAMQGGNSSNLFSLLDNFLTGARTLESIVDRNLEGSAPQETQRVWNLTNWLEDGERFHLLATSALGACSEQSLLELESPVPSEVSFLDSIPFGAWNYYPSRDEDLGVTHTWTASTRSDADQTDGAVSLLVLCWDSDALIGPVFLPFSDAGKSITVSGSGVRDVRLILDGEETRWQTVAFDGNTIGLFPPNDAEAFIAPGQEEKTNISLAALAQIAQAEEARVGLAYPDGPRWGTVSLVGIDEVLSAMEERGCA